MLCCIGDLVEDVVVWPQAELRRGTDTPARIFRRRGGSAATVAVYAVTVGVAARFVGRVGDDALGARLIAQLDAAGVDTNVTRGGRTGSIVVLVDGSGERTMIPDRAAAMELDELPRGALDGVTWLHVPAYSLVVEPLGATSLLAIDTVREAGGTVSIDASSVGPLEAFGTNRFISLMAQIGPEVFLCNQDEAAWLGIEGDTPLSGAGITVVKAGADPVTIIDSAGGVNVVEVPPVDGVADTTGAGDAFAAGFIAASMNSATPPVAAEAGCRLAATVLTRPGA